MYIIMNKEVPPLIITTILKIIQKKSTIHGPFQKKKTKK